MRLFLKIDTRLALFSDVYDGGSLWNTEFLCDMSFHVSGVNTCD